MLTAVATVVLLLKLAPISYLAEGAVQASFSGGDLNGLRMSLAIHAAGGLLVLLAAVTLAIYKPRGMTPYGLRKQREPGNASEESGSRSVMSTPRWVKIVGVVLAILILGVGAMLLLGGHGPGAHMPDG